MNVNRMASVGNRIEPTALALANAQCVVKFDNEIYTGEYKLHHQNAVGRQAEIY
jgi:hypothetical protein